jgi:hypothetical protein
MSNEIWAEPETADRANTFVQLYVPVDVKTKLETGARSHSISVIDYLKYLVNRDIPQFEPKPNKKISAMSDDELVAYVHQQREQHFWDSQYAVAEILERYAEDLKRIKEKLVPRDGKIDSFVETLEEKQK